MIESRDTEVINECHLRHVAPVPTYSVMAPSELNNTVLTDKCSQMYRLIVAYLINYIIAKMKGFLLPSFGYLSCMRS